MASDPGEGGGEHARTRTLELSEGEALLLLKICRKYRSSLPIYLKSAQVDLAILDRIVSRLS